MSIMNDSSVPGGSGTPILGALVVIAILGTVALSLDTLANTPGTDSQLAATAGSSAVTVASSEIQAKCQELANSTDGVAPTTEQTTYSDVTRVQKHLCVAVVAGEKGDIRRCVGMESVVVIGSGGTAVSISQPKDGVPPGKCETSFCKPGGQCESAGEIEGANPTSKEALLDPDTLSQLSPETQRFIASSLPESTQDALNNAFQERIGSVDEQIAAQRAAVQEAESALGASGDPSEAVPRREALERERARLADLQEQRQRLADARVRLEPDPPAGDPPPQPYAQSGYTDGSPNDNTFDESGQGMQMPQMPQGGGGSGSGSGSGLGQQCQRTGQRICSTDGTSIEEYDAQCRERFVRQCAEGCVSGQCRGQSGLCQPPPAQPAASECPNGTYQPTYEGACVKGWQCSSGSGGAPEAKISCQPDVLDVGMELAISYSCSAGVSKGSGFTADAGQSGGGAHSGSASVTIETPPANTNTATYTLTCTDQGRSSNASCNVQIGKPGIVFTTNPSKVAPGETATLGWVTAGAESCVISSPTDAAFTDENAYNKSVNGTATTLPITSNTEFIVRCTTHGGKTIEERAVVEVI